MQHRALLLPLAAFLFGPATVAAADKTWVDVASSDGSVWAMKAGSFSFSTNKNGTPIAVVVGRVTTKKTVFLYQWYVTAKDCKNGMGTVVSLSPQGDFQFESDFVVDAGNIASTIAGIICDTAKSEIEETDGKGI